MSAILRAARQPLHPPAHPILGHLPAFCRDPLAFLTESARSYGPAVPLRLLHIPALLLLDPDDIERVLVTDHRDYVKPAWLRTAAIRRALGRGLVTIDGDEWREDRHACSPAFHPSRNREYAETIGGIVERRIAAWSVGEAIGLQREMSRLTLEVV
ncbi:MAG TPA: cytochrome P450, partial [Chthonomonadaceae bacterium]|nr:cytochrome P450 [Chthonomonadaceae bacterium]